LPIAYARVAAAGGRFPAASSAAVGGYVTVAAGLWWLPGMGAVGSALVAAAGVATACRLAGRIKAAEPGEVGRRGRLSSGGRFACRTAIPVVYVVTTRLIRHVAGSGFAGRFVTFPGGSLAVLVTTHLEAGPGTACRLAAAMPTGGLGMLAFLTTFRFGCRGLGLGWATAAGFVAAVTMLAVVGALTGREKVDAVKGDSNAEVMELRSDSGPRLKRRRVHTAHAPGRPRRSRADVDSRRRGEVNRNFEGRVRRPRRRRFSPRVEALAG
jgi:hypothetical protein